MAAVLTSEGLDEDQTPWPGAGPVGADSGQAEVSLQKLSWQKEQPRNTSSVSPGEVCKQRPEDMCHRTQMS